MGAGVSCFDAPLAEPPFPPDLPLPVDTSGIKGGGTSDRVSLGFPGRSLFLDLDFFVVSFLQFLLHLEWTSWRPLF